MARSTLNTTGESNPVVRKGHGTGALGPSDSTDSGSDIVGGPGLNRDDGLPLQRGTTSDPDIDPRVRRRVPTSATRTSTATVTATAPASAAQRVATPPKPSTRR